MSAFKKQKPCQSVKIWSKEDMENEMMLFGWSVFNQFQRDIQSGDADSSNGCIYSNQFFMASAVKTKGGCASVCVARTS